MADDYEKSEAAIWKWLQDLPVGSVKTISKSPNPEQFTKIAKNYADVTGMIEFNQDYTKIRRIAPLWETSDEELKETIYENYKNSTKPGSDKTK